MRSSILELLKNAGGTFISGEDIARRLKVSRTAVWKHIRELRQAGYAIESQSRSGYCLTESPDLLFPSEVERAITTNLIGKEIHYYKEIDSTNNQAKLLADSGAKDGAIVLSESQNGGRGRLSRGWVAPFGKGIWLSVILRPGFLPQEAPKCTLMAAVAIARAIETATGIRCGIKWPNDILYEGKKLVGILTEMNAEMDAINYVVVGMGTNVNLEEADFPGELKKIATSLSLIKGEKIPRLPLLAEILKQLEFFYLQALECGFTGILEEWKSYSVTLERDVRVIGLDDEFTGVAVDIDSFGALLVKTDGGIKRVLAGDVSVRPNV